MGFVLRVFIPDFLLTWIPISDIVWSSKKWDYWNPVTHYCHFFHNKDSKDISNYHWGLPMTIPVSILSAVRDQICEMNVWRRTAANKCINPSYLRIYCQVNCFAHSFPPSHSFHLYLPAAIFFLTTFLWEAVIMILFHSCFVSKW